MAAVIQDLVFATLDVVFKGVLKKALDFKELEVWHVSESINTTNNSNFTVYAAVENEGGNGYGSWDWEARDLDLRLQMGFNILFITTKVENGVVYVGFAKNLIELREKNNWDEPTGKYFKNYFRISNTDVKYFRKIYRLTRGFADTISHEFKTGEYEVSSSPWTWTFGGKWLKICMGILKNQNVTVEPSSKLLFSKTADVEPYNLLCEVKGQLFGRSNGNLCEYAVSNMIAGESREHIVSTVQAPHVPGGGTNFNDVKAMVEHNDDIWFAKDNNLYKYHTIQVMEPGYIYGTAGPRGTEPFLFGRLNGVNAMAVMRSEGKLLFSIQSFPTTGLYEYNITPKTFTKVGEAGAAVTVLPETGSGKTRVYLVDVNGTLTWKEEGSTTWNNVGQAGDWTGTRAMTTLSGSVYIAKGSNLFRIIAETHEIIDLGDGDNNNFSTIGAMTIYQGNIYATMGTSIQVIFPHVTIG